MKRILCSLLVAACRSAAFSPMRRSRRTPRRPSSTSTSRRTFPARASRACSSNTARGGFSPGHTHPKSAFIYATVLEGAIRSKVNDGPETTYKAGQSFSELPGDHHGVSANASKTKPAKLSVSDEKTNTHGPLAKAGLQSMRPAPPEMGVGDEHGSIALRDNR